MFLYSTKSIIFSVSLSSIIKSFVEISNFLSTEIEWIAVNKIKLNDEDKEKMIKFLEILEDDEDVQNVFTNAM